MSTQLTSVFSIKHQFRIDITVLKVLKFKVAMKKYTYSPKTASYYTRLQNEVSKVEYTDYNEYIRTGDTKGFAALKRLDAAFDKIIKEVKTVTDVPAVWFLYNMGFVIKSRETCFAIDLRHVRGEEFAPLLDFALITHNHGDHYTESFYRAMNGKGKTVISNFLDNYGARDVSKNGGYTRAEKTFNIKDVEIKTALTDHNPYLADFTTTFEITIGGKYRIFHSGDCSNPGKLNPAPGPDLWIVHPCCGMNVADGVKKFKPKCTIIAHINELGHPTNLWRWSWQCGLEQVERVENAGGMAIVPTWGDRVK